jgi:hypothetical protein
MCVQVQVVVVIGIPCTTRMHQGEQQQMRIWAHAEFVP